jgi:hypothetical protein
MVTCRTGVIVLLQPVTVVALLQLCIPRVQVCVVGAPMKETPTHTTIIHLTHFDEQPGFLQV